jgi:hypothetical protein
MSGSSDSGPSTSSPEAASPSPKVAAPTLTSVSDRRTLTSSLHFNRAVGVALETGYAQILLTEDEHVG